MAQTKLEQAMPFELLEANKIGKGNLRQLAEGMKSLLQSFQYDMKIELEENNGILTGVCFEVKIKNLK